MQRDLVLRWLEQLSALIARFLRKDPTITILILEERIDEAERQVVGPLGPLLNQLEPRAAAELLADPYRIEGAAELLAFRAAIAGSRGNAALAQRLTDRALALIREAIARADPVPSEWEERARELARALDRPAVEP